MHDDPVGRSGRDLPQELLADRGMRDRFELFAGLVGDEGTFREPGAIERTVRLQDLGSERLGQRCQRGLAGFDHFPRDLVGVDDHGAALDEHARNCRFTGADPASEPDHQHTAQSTGGLRIRFGMPT